jgi:PleD family two-component response regulator
MKRQRILIGDCESDFVAEASKALKGSYEVTVASSRKESLEKAKGECPDMVIVGFLEPRGDSFKLYKELKENPETSNIPLLVVDVRPEDYSRKVWRRHERAKMDIEGYLTRPIEFGELREAVERIFRSADPEPLALEETLERMEKLLEQVEKIEKMLTI